MKSVYKIYLSIFLMAAFFSCKKLTDIPEPTNTITSSETFSNEANATSAVSAIYNKLAVNSAAVSYSNCGVTIFGGLSADELAVFGGQGQDFQLNQIPSDDGLISASFWSNAYFNIYQANAVIEGVQASSSLGQPVKDRLTGESKFLRAFIYFYLVNLFGDVPLVQSTAWETTSLLPRSPVADVYQQIIADLKDAVAKLPEDYSVSNGNRTRANRWAAKALLARVYLYTGGWADAIAESSAIISNTDLFGLESDLNFVFRPNGNEDILQYQTNTDIYPYTTFEGNQMVPPDTTSSPNYTVTDQLLAAFEPGDKRRTAWIDTTDFSGAYYYYPYKYKVYVGDPSNVTENYTVLRLAEQYLIRAEAEAKADQSAAAITDLNVIRQRAGLPDLDASITGDQLFQAIAQERRIELFAEWGHRWLDLKRTGQANAVLQPLKPTWTSTATLWPIPYQELRANPNLEQNPGYQ